jgi:hypothetical protein
MGGGADLLRRPDEQLRPAGLRHQRLQREPVAVPAGPLRHVDRRDRRGVLRDQPQRLDRGRQRRLRAGPERRRRRQARQLALGLGAGDPGRHPAGRRGQAVHRMGDLEGVHRTRRRERGLGERAAGRAHLALREPGIPGGSLRPDDARVDQRGRSEQPDGRSGALCRHPVRRDPRVRGHRHRGQPGVSPRSTPVSRPSRRRWPMRRR